MFVQVTEVKEEISLDFVLFVLTRNFSRIRTVGSQERRKAGWRRTGNEKRERLDTGNREIDSIFYVCIKIYNIRGPTRQKKASYSEKGIGIWI